MDEKAEFAARLKQAMLDAGYEPRPSVIEREFNQRYWGARFRFRPPANGCWVTPYRNKINYKYWPNG
jgi:hypothetical protein